MSEEANLRTPGEADAETNSEDALTRAALDYHRYPTPGKISVLPTKDMTTQRDLALAYSPGVAAACMAIKHDPIEASNLTSRGNLVAVISNGTAVPFEITATRLPREVRLEASIGSSLMARHAAATPGE